MERQSDTAGEVARFLSTHPAVEHVNYPGMPSHPQHQIAKKQMTKFGSMMSFIVVGGDNAAITVVNVSYSLKSLHVTPVTGDGSTILSLSLIHI